MPEIGLRSFLVIVRGWCAGKFPNEISHTEIFWTPYKITSHSIQCPRGKNTQGAHWTQYFRDASAARYVLFLSPFIQRFGFWIICRVRCESNTKYKQPCSFSITKLNLSTACSTHSHTACLSHKDKSTSRTWKVILFGRSLILKPPSIMCLCRFSHCLLYIRAARARGGWNSRWERAHAALENEALLLGKKRCNLSSISCSMAEISRTSYLTREIKLQHVILRRAKQANHSPFSHTKQAYPHLSLKRRARERACTVRALSCFPFRITIDFCLARQ
jgi:hypothetical protein